MRRLLFACLLMGSAHAFALDRLQVEGYTLRNGLQLLLKPGTERGHVAIRLVVGVGLDDFSCADKELPHLLEHLLFSGIDASGEGGLEERMQALGGEWNAYTSNADTTFVIEAPAKNQRQVLDLLLALLTQTAFRRQRHQRRQAGGRARRRWPLLSPAALAGSPGPGPHRQQPTGGGTGPQMRRSGQKSTT